VLRDNTTPVSGSFYLPQDIIDAYFKKFETPAAFDEKAGSPGQEAEKTSPKPPGPDLSTTSAVIPLTDLFEDLLLQDTIDTKSDSIIAKDSLAPADTSKLDTVKVDSLALDSTARLKHFKVVREDVPNTTFKSEKNPLSLRPRRITRGWSRSIRPAGLLTSGNISATCLTGIP